MKITILLIGLAITTSAFARDTYVKPHIRKDGTFVEGHHRSTPDSSRMNNYSSQGNYNPYTGQSGTVDPYQPRTNNYPSTFQPERRCVKDLYGNCM